MSTDRQTWADESVTTWADGFGTWHARVDFPSPGYGDYIADAIDRIRAKARRAIRRELAARGAIGAGYRIRLEVVAQDQDSLNRIHSITYREV